jgi:hypothetical protein
VSELVLAYFAEHPRAMDTAAGIAEWWMPEKILPNHEVMSRVLERLTQQGVLEHIGAGESVRYRLKTR